MRQFIKNSLSLVLMLLLVQFTSAQVLYNNGADIKVNTGGIVKVQGSAENATGTVSNEGYITVDLDITNGGTIQGSGTFEIWRHWINNATFLGNSSNTSLVYLNGSVTQNIQGSQVTTFWDLEIDNALRKQLFLNSGVNNTLSLHNNELAAETFTFFVYNTNVNAVLRDAGATYGFVSALGSGSLSRMTNVSQTYVFPVGSNVGTLRYRPIDIKPKDATANTFTVRMANVDATTEGYDRTLFDANICQVEPDFYHRINRTNGAANADIKFYYDQASDGSWSNLANWNASLWADMGTVTHISGTPFNTVEKASWSDFTNDPYALTNIVPIVTVSADVTICNGDNTTLTASGADTYVWTNDQDGTSSTDNPFTVSPTVTTVYTVVGTTGGCSSTEQSITVTVNDIAITDFTNTDASCGNSDGTSTVNVTGGDGNFSYNWNPSGQTTNPATGLGANSYSVTVTDNNGSGCSVEGNTTISEAGSPTVTVSSSATDICPGESVTLTASGADSYTWSATNGTFNPASADVNPIDLDNITANTTITVTGTTSGCSDVQTIDVNVYPDIVISNILETCNAGQTDYTVTFDISGGDAASYTVTPAGTLTGSTFTSNPITSGTAYSFTIDDANGCNPQTISGTQTCSCPITANISSTDFEICDGATADISIDLAGGSFPYSITYNDGTSNIVVSGINASPYILQVTPTTATTYTLVDVSDANCTGTATGTITVSINDISITDFTNTDATCGVSDAQSTVNATGGDANYTYNWSTTPVQNTNPATGLGAGGYSVTVTDNGGSGCSVVGNTTISEAGAPTVTVSSSATDICSGTGVTLTASGADSYTWTASNGTFNPASADVNPIDLDNITANTTITVTGTTSGCSDVQTVDVNVYSDIVISNITETCNAGQTDYTVTFDISGGDAASYTVTPSGTLTGSTFTSNPITSGTAYSFTVNDANGCNPQTVSGTHTCNCSVVANITTTNFEICDGATADISIDVSGGSFPYSITYNDGISDIVINGINASPYNLQVTPTSNTTYTLVSVSDGSCTGTATGTITISVNDLSISSVDLIANEVCGDGQGSAIANVTGGTAPYTYLWSPSGETTQTAVGLAEGVNSVIITDQNGSGCSVTGTVTIGNDGAPTITVTAPENSICSNSSVVLTASGADTYSWLPNDGSLSATVGATVTASPDQTTTYTVTGSVGTCSNTESITITVSQQPIVVIDKYDASCGNNDGKAWISITGSGGNIIEWSTGASTDTIHNLSAGTYSVSVTSGACISTASITLIQSGTLPVDILYSSDTICEASTISLTAINAQDYTWTSLPDIGINGSTSNPLTATISESTTFYVQGEENGCQGNASVFIHVLPYPKVTAKPDTICLGDSVLLSIESNYNFEWLNLPNGHDPFKPYHTVAPTHTTTYQISVDNGSCPTLIKDVPVVVHQLPTVEIFVQNNPIWGGEFTTLTASGAVSYSWMPVDDLASPYEAQTIANPVFTTFYTVTGTDANGCVNTDTLTLEVQHNDVLYVPNVFSPNDDGENDVLYARGTGFRKIYFVVYDRWGEKVFETEDSTVGWDGTFRGEKLDPAVFVYYVKAVFWDSKEIKQHGSVTLVK